MASKQIEFDAVVNAAQINRLLTDLRSEAQGAAKAINDALGGTVTKKIVFEEVLSDRGTKQLVAVEKERLSVADQLINRQKTLNKTQEGSKTNLQQQLNNLRQQRDGVVRYQQDINGVAGSIRKQRPEWTALNAEVSRIQRELAIAGASTFWEQIKVATRTQGLINFGNGLVGITQQLQAASIIVGQFLGAINQVVDTAAKLQSFALSFKAIGAGSAGSVKALQEISKIALGLGVDINTVQEGFKQLSPVILNLGGSSNNVSAIVESLSSRFAAFGISGDRARRVLNGVIQAFAKGKLQAEELTQQISEADPAFKTDFASALLKARGSLGDLGKEVDGTVSNLEKLVKQGKITGDVLLRVLPGLSKSSLLFGKLGPTAGSAVDALERGSVTIDQVRSNLSNLNQISLRQLATTAEPLINAFLRIQAVVTDFFTRISQSSALGTFVNIATKVVDVVGRIVDIFLIAAEGVVKVVEVFKPLIDVLTAIPGVATAAGLALAGRLLGPLNLFQKRVESTRTAWQGFTMAIRGVFVAPGNEIKGITKAVKDLQQNISKPIGVGTAAVAGAASPESTAEAAGKAIDRVTALGDAASSQIQQQISRLESGIARARQKLDESRGRPVQATNQSAEQDVLTARLAGARAELTQLQAAAADGAAQATFSAQELERQRRLQAAIDASTARLRTLRSEQARLRGQAAQARRSAAGFDPGSTDRIREASDELRKFAEAEKIANDPALKTNAKERKRIYEELASIEQRRAGFAAMGMKFFAEDLDTSKVDELRAKLADLDNQRQSLTRGAKIAAATETDLANAFKLAADESASFAARQGALGKVSETLSTALRSIAGDAMEAKARLNQLNEERKRLTAQQGGRAFTGPVAADDSLLQSLRQNAIEIENTKRQLSALDQEASKIQGNLSGLSNIVDLNGRVASQTSNRFARFGTVLRSGFTGALRGVRGAIGGVFSGLKGLVGLIDPLTAILLAAGFASRLYADGNREASEAAKRYKDQLDALNASISDITPGSQKAEQSTTALGRAWQTLASGSISVGNFFGSVFENVAQGFEGITKVIGGFSGSVADQAADLPGTIRLILAFGAAGAAIGTAFSPLGTIIGAAIGGVTGTVIALGSGAANSTGQLDQLKNKLKEIGDGSAANTEAVLSLAEGIEKIAKSGDRELAGDNYRQAREGLELLKNTANQTEKDLRALEATRTGNQKLIAGNDKRIQQLKQESKALEGLIARLSAGNRGPEATGQILALKQKLGELNGEIRSVEGANSSLTAKNEELSSSIGQLGFDLEQQKDALKRVSEAANQAGQALTKTASSIGEIEAAIQFLQEGNKGLKLTDPKDRAELDANLTKIKQLQDILEFFSKTRYEIEIEVRATRRSIAESIDAINLEPGPRRDTNKLVRDSADDVRQAGEVFRQKIEAANNAIKQANISAVDGARKIEISGQEYADSILKATAGLVDAGRDLVDKLRGAQNSLASLKLSKPEFFSGEELRKNAEEINRRFNEEVAKSGVNPRLTGRTQNEKLQQKLSFVETRQEAEKLTKSIDEISGSLETITQLLAKIAKEDLAKLKKNGVDIKGAADDTKKSIAGAGQELDNVAKAAPRIGQVFGRISGGGKDLVLYFDNATGKVEEVTAAQFKALQAADKLAVAGKNVGNGYAQGAVQAATALGKTESRVGEVLGTISANGKTQVIYYDKLTKSTETVSQEAFNRLEAEQLVTKQAESQLSTSESQVAAFEAQVKAIQGIVKGSKAAAAAQAAAHQDTPGLQPQASGPGGFVFFPSNMISEEQANRNIREIATRVGGDYVKTLAEVIASNGKDLGFMPLGKLGALQDDISTYRSNLQSLKIAQDQVTEAQRRYDQGLAAGSADILTLAGNLRNAKDALANVQTKLGDSAATYQRISEAARQLGIDIQSIPSIGETIGGSTEGTSQALGQWNEYVNSVISGSQRIAAEANVNPLAGAAAGVSEVKAETQQALSTWNEYVQRIQQGVGKVNASPGLNEVETDASSIQTSLDNAATGSDRVNEAFADAASQAETISDRVLALDGTTIEVFVKQTPIAQPFFAGGAVTGGKQIQVNELGQEGFLSTSGKLSPINAPAYGLWRTPGAGTVIPAHIMDGLSVPRSGVKVSSQSKPAPGNSMQRVLRTVLTAAATQRSADPGLMELANVQAKQAIQIGKLSRVVKQLAEKDWSVNVNVRPNTSNSYLNTLNHRL